MAHSHMAEMLDLDAEVLHDFHSAVYGWVREAAAPRPVVVDLGAGTGVGSVALLRELPEATVIAVDKDPEMLAHLREKTDRVRTVEADLDGTWPDLGPADVVWASASMHHMSDPAHAVAQVKSLLRPGGVFVVSELESFPRFLAGADAELEQRCHDVLAELRAEHGMHMSEDWGARLTAAGFADVAQRRFDIELTPPLPAAAGRYAYVALSRMAQGLAGRLPQPDLDALARIADGVEKRDDLTVRTTRTVWLARA